MNTEDMNKIPNVNYREGVDKICDKCKEPFRTVSKNITTCAVCRFSVPVRFRKKTSRHYAKD